MEMFFSRLVLTLFSLMLNGAMVINGFHLCIVFYRQCRKRPLPHPHSFTAFLRFLFMLSLFAYLSCRMNRAGLRSFLIHSGLTLLFCALCFILENIIRQGGIQRAMDEIISQFLEKINISRNFFQLLGDFLQKHRGLTYALMLLPLLIGSLISGSMPTAEGVVFISLSLLVGYCSYLAYALHSCRRLILLLIVFSFVYAMQVAATVEYVCKNSAAPQTNDSLLIIILVVYVLLWIFTALIADDEPVQMVFKIVNTFTTLAAIAGNILIPMFSVQVAAHPQILPGYDNNTAFTIVFNLFILPLVAAGYMAQLVKDIQIYFIKKQ